MTTEAAGRWLAETEAGEFKPVVRLAEIVAHLARVKALPPARARSLACQTIGQSAAQLFIASDGLDDAAPLVTDAMEWRSALATELRGLELDRSDPGAAVLIDERARQAPAMPAARGKAGALEVWSLAYVPGAAVAAPELVSRLSALGMFEADAAALFPELAEDLLPSRSFWEADHPDATPMRAALPAVALTFPAGPVAQPSVHETPATPWTDDRLATRRTEIDQQRPPVKTPMVLLLQEAGISDTPAHRKDVQRRINSARSSRAAATAMSRLSATVVRDGMKVRG